MIGNAIDARLMSSANFVRAGAVLADIGTDHGYLPIFLLKEGRIRHAVLSDINEGPLAAAEQNVKAEGLSDKCTLILSDGAASLTGLGITDYAICGMGGELIARIIGDAPDMRREGVRLILQPMSRFAIVRETLSSLGFRIIDERYSSAAGRPYVSILAEYTGEVRDIDSVTAELGDEREHTSDREDYVFFLRKKLASLERAAHGKKEGGEDVSFELELCDEIKRRLSKLD